jgi:hypothetical protein
MGNCCGAQYDGLGTEFYLAYRGHSLDSQSLDVDDIHTFWSGARVKF